MTSKTQTVTVNGEAYEVWSDYIKRGTLAKCVNTNDVKVIKHSGYISNELTIRKAIATAFGLRTFRK